MSMLKRLRSNPLYFLFFADKVKNTVLLIFTLLFNLIAALLEGASFAFILFSFTVLSGEKPAFLKEGWLLSYVSNFDQTQLFCILMLGAVATQVLRSAFTYFGQMLTVWLTVNLQTDAQNIIYRQIFRLTFSSVNRYKVGDLIHYATAPPTYFRGVIEWVNRFIVATMMILAYIVFMVRLSFSLTICTIFLFGLCAFLQKILIKKIVKASKNQTEHMVELNKETAQTLSGLRTIHLFNRQNHILKQVGDMLKNIASSAVRLNKWNQLIAPVNEVIAVMLVATTMILSLVFLKGTNVEILAVLLTFLALTYRLGTRLQVVMSACGEIAYNMGPIERLQEILNNDDKEFFDSKPKPFISFKQNICFEHISFKYPKKQTYAVQDISLTVEKGKTIAFVGSSGGGKSSLLDLLLRLYEPTDGSIHVDGKPITDFSLSSWRNLFGVVSQDVFLFHESIESNIRFGNPDATEELVIEAAQLAGAHDFIKHLPCGYQTTVGEKGYKLSGGERQRISLARALIRNPEVLVLDEATSNLDSQSERFIQNALERLQGKTTMLVVAHRLATINMADRIIMLDNGRIIEQGTHHDLIQLGGRYRHFWSLQASPVREKAPIPHLSRSTSPL